MHKIDLHNYEAYLLDFSEGNLTGELQVELELFLIQHPELEMNLDELALVSLDNDTISFSDKANLKRTDADLVSGAQFIAYIENQLTTEERLEIEKSCTANPSLLKELALYNNTIATTDETIFFENKQSLKRKPKVIWFSFSVMQYAAAACVVFLIGLFMLWPKTNLELNGLALVNKKDLMKTNNEALLNTNSSTTNNNIIHPEESNTSLAQHSSTNKNQQSLLANHLAKQENNITSIKDTLPAIAHNSPIIESPKNETLVALNVVPVVKPKTIVQVITENDDEVVTTHTDKKKKGIWATASRALKNLNHVGVKSVNGDEEETKDNTAYAITLGGVSITHKAGL